MLIEFRDKQRLLSVDAFRGMAIAIMLIVNALPDFEQANPWLIHAPWTGMTIADLAFPGFVFIMGVSGALWFPKHKQDRPEDQLAIILRRSLLLIMIGFFLNQYPLMLEHWFHSSSESLLGDIFQHGRVMGVLQRLGLVYFFGMLLTWWLRSEKLLGIMALMLLGVSSLCFHLYDTTNSFSPENNISMLIDGLFPGAAHCYMGKSFDPEGLYGTMAATASFLLGMLAGKYLTMRNAPAFERVLTLLVVGTGLLGLGGVWSYTDVISKQLWTAPYVLFTSGGFMWLLGLLEMSNTLFPDFSYWLFTPCRIWGLNPLFMFIVPDMVLMFLWQLQIHGEAFYPLLWEITLKGIMDVQLSIFFFALIWAVLWLPVANFLYKRRIILKL